MTVVREVSIVVKVIDEATSRLKGIQSTLNSLPKQMTLVAGSTSAYTKTVNELGTSFSNVNRAIAPTQTTLDKFGASATNAAKATQRVTADTKKLADSNRDLIYKLRATASGLDALQMYRFGNTAYSLAFLVSAMNNLGHSVTDVGGMFTFLKGKLNDMQFGISGSIMSLSMLALKIPLIGGLLNSLGLTAAGGVLAIGSLGAAMIAVLLAMTASIPIAAQWQTQMANIAKTTGLAGTSLEMLSISLMTVAGSSGVASEDIARMGVIAGQVGIEGTANITAFTRAVADAAIAFDMSGDAAATYVAKLSNIYDIKPTEIHHMTSAITELGNTTAATENEIMDYMLTLGNTMEMLGATSDEAAAFGTTLISLGIDASRAGTEMNSAMMFLMRPANLGKLARLGGMSKGEFLSGDFDQNLLKVIKGIAAIEDPVKRNNMLVERFGFIGAKAMRSLVENVDDLEKNLKASKKAFEEGTAAGEEAKKKRETFGAEWQNTINLLKQIFITLGEPLLPVATFLLRFLNQLLRVAIVVAQFISLLATPLVWLGNILNWISNLLGKIDILPNLIMGTGAVVSAAHNPTSAADLIRGKSHASGLENVPFDNYMARLHKGEMVLSARQASQLRNESKNFKAADQMLRDALHGTGTLYPVGDVLKGTATGARASEADKRNISFFNTNKEITQIAKNTEDMSWWMRIWYRLLEVVRSILWWIYDVLKKVDSVLNHIPSEMLKALLESPKAIAHGIAAVAEVVIGTVVEWLIKIYNGIAGTLSFFTRGASESWLPKMTDEKIEEGRKKMRDDFAKLHEWINEFDWKNLFPGSGTSNAGGPSSPWMAGTSAAQAYKMQVDQATKNAAMNNPNFNFVDWSKVNVMNANAYQQSMGGFKNMPMINSAAFKFDTGGLARTPQMAFLAGGGPEAVLPARLTSFLMSAATNPSSGPVNLTLNINNPSFRDEHDKQDLIREVKREMVKFYDVLEKRDVRFTRQQVN